MEKDEIKSLIKEVVQETLEELFFLPREIRDIESIKAIRAQYLEKRHLLQYSDALGNQIVRLSALVTKFESWSSSGCGYEKSKIADIERLLGDISAKLP